MINPLPGIFILRLVTEVAQTFGEAYKLVEPMASEWARLSFEGQVWGVSEPDEPNQEIRAIWNAKASKAKDGATLTKEQLGKHYTQRLDLGLWDAEVTYGRSMFWINPPVGNAPPSGGALIAKLSDNEYLVLNFTSTPHLLKIKLSTY